MVASCKANGCTSCSVCDDNKTIAVDCGRVVPPGQWYHYGCDHGYTGSLANTYNFPAIVAGEEKKEDESPADPATDHDGPPGRDSFCGHLAGLEGHMTEGFEERMGKTYTTSFECSCLEVLREGTFSVECSTEGSESGRTFAASELMTFDSDGGNYRLIETSWQLETSDGPALPNQGILTIVNGTAASCVANGCALCDDGVSIATIPFSGAACARNFFLTKPSSSSLVKLLSGLTTPSGNATGHWSGNGHAPALFTPGARVEMQHRLRRRPFALVQLRTDRGRRRSHVRR